MLVQDDEWPVVKLSNDDDEEDWVEAAFCFYKQSKFNRSAGVLYLFVVNQLWILGDYTGKLSRFPVPGQ